MIATMKTIVQARQLTKTFGHFTAVDNIDMDVPNGGCFGLLGPNGAGKTTILRMLLGQSHPSSGQLEVLGQSMPANTRAVRRRIGVVPQTDNLDPDFTVLENLRIYTSYFDLKYTELKDHIDDLISLVELEDKRNTKITALSGGMKRRLSIARALVNKPELLVLDEPTTGLDPQVRHLIWSRLRELKQSGTTLLLTTHYMEEAERLCDDLIIMDAGKILHQGHPKKLIAQHVESDVIEVHATIEQTKTLFSTITDVRYEVVDEIVYCFTNKPVPVIRQLEQSASLTWLHRPANLEDVFLGLTGRDLHEAQ
ncbi:MAG: lipooligosaccharide transport system ATP-binding protein [Planctomycetota bacterium]|jgi:lipooligosaccharide transport system ATP-binding protein